MCANVVWNGYAKRNFISKKLATVNDQLKQSADADVRSLLKVSLPVVVIPLKHRLLTVNYWLSNTTVVEQCAPSWPAAHDQLTKLRGLICKRDIL